MDKTPLIAEKPFISIDPKGAYMLNIPLAKEDSKGSDFASKPTVVPFERVYAITTKSGNIFSVGIFLDFVWLTTCAEGPHGGCIVRAGSQTKSN